MAALEASASWRSVPRHTEKLSVWASHHSCLYCWVAPPILQALNLGLWVHGAELSAQRDSVAHGAYLVIAFKILFVFIMDVCIKT